MRVGGGERRGKTTTIKLLMKYSAADGGNGGGAGSFRASGWRGKAFARIAYVSENQELPDAMTVAEMLAYLRGCYPGLGCGAGAARWCGSSICRWTASLKHLSRGMRMKAAFAGSLAYRPRLIVLDEPFSGLDPLVRDELIESLLERGAEDDDLSVVARFGKRLRVSPSHVGYLEGGRCCSPKRWRC